MHKRDGLLHSLHVLPYKWIWPVSQRAASFWESMPFRMMGIATNLPTFYCSPIISWAGFYFESRLSKSKFAKSVVFSRFTLCSISRWSSFCFLWKFSLAILIWILISPKPSENVSFFTLHVSVMKIKAICCGFFGSVLALVASCTYTGEYSVASCTCNKIWFNSSLPTFELKWEDNGISGLKSWIDSFIRDLNLALKS